MTSRAVQMLVGGLWTLSGALMAIDLPREDLLDPGEATVVSVIVLVGGLYFFARALCALDVEASGRPPRHSRGEFNDVFEAVKFIVLCTLTFTGGACLLWWGFASGSLFAVGAGTAVTAMSVVLLPQVFSAVNWLLRS